MTTLHIVLGECGEYSDRTEWLVAAYTTEATAQAKVEDLQAKWRELAATVPPIPASTGHLGIAAYRTATHDRADKRREAEAAMKAHDPNFLTDYHCETRWYTSTVELIA